MPKLFICALFIAVVLLCGCPKPAQLSTETGVAIGGGGAVPVAATEPHAFKRVGPENPELKWFYNIPPEAEMTMGIHALNTRNIPHVEVGYDGTAYFTAWALPAAKEEQTFLDEAQEQAYDDYVNQRQPKAGETLDLGRKSTMVSSLAKNAPKEDWLFAVGPDGTFKWVFKAPGGPVGMPMLSSSGDIVIGTYGIHARDFNKSRSTEDDPREHSGGIFIVRPNGELLREIDPGGWLDRIMPGPADTLICRISDEGDALLAEDLKDPLRRSPLREPSYRYTAVNLDGEVLWEKPEESFNVIDADQDGMLLVATDDGIYLVDPLTGEPGEKYRAPDPRTAEWGWSEYADDGVLYSVDSDQEAISELIAGTMTIKEANNSVPLVKYDRDNNKLWEVLAGMGVMDLAARPDGSLLMVRSLAVYDSQAPYGFRDEQKLICLDENSEVAWSYLDDVIGQLWTITLDDEMNCYITANGHWGKSCGVVSLDSAGNLRWQLPNDRVQPYSGLTFGPAGTMYIVTNDVVYAYGEKEEGKE